MKFEKTDWVIVAVCILIIWFTYGGSPRGDGYEHDDPPAHPYTN